MKFKFWTIVFAALVTFGLGSKAQAFGNPYYNQGYNSGSGFGNPYYSQGGYNQGNPDRNPNAQAYQRNEALGVARVQAVVVVAINVVEVDPSSTATMAGRTVGGVIGAAALNRYGEGKSGATQGALTALGGLLGAIGGDAVADRTSTEQAWEIVVLAKNGEMLVITQAGDLPGQIGDVVGLTTRGNTARLIAMPQPRRSATTATTATTAVID